jgi:cyanophycinase
MKRWIVLLSMMLAWTGQPLGAKLPYTYVRIGNAADATPTAPLLGGTVLMGGSTEVDAAFVWMCSRSAGGDFLVIRASGTDAYNAYIQGLCATAGKPAHSVATLIIPTATAANDPRVAELIGKAEAVWIAGGDQSDYITQWQNTPVQVALQARITRGAPVGGTSAGLNVLTPFVYSAQASKGVTSSQALADPFNRYMSFARDFAAVPALAGTLGDPHFAARDRMGRDLAFLCRVYSDYGTVARGIAVDEQTALLVDTAGSATVVGSGSVYFLQPPGPPEVCKAKTPLTYLNIDVYRIEVDGSFELLGTGSGSGGVAYRVSADRGALSSSNGSIY